MLMVKPNTSLNNTINIESPIIYGSNVTTDAKETIDKHEQS